jgi:hypothetical protein
MLEFASPRGLNQAIEYFWNIFNLQDDTVFIRHDIRAARLSEEKTGLTEKAARRKCRDFLSLSCIIRAVNRGLTAKKYKKASLWLSGSANYDFPRSFDDP